MRTIYLAGPMENIDLKSMSGWRNNAARQLRMNGWKVLDPVARSLKDGYNHKRIYELDMRDVRESDVILADLRRANRECHGTSMEVQEAYRNDIPVMGWATFQQKRHPFLEVCVTEWCVDLDVGIKVLNDFYL